MTRLALLCLLLSLWLPLEAETLRGKLKGPPSQEKPVTFRWQGKLVRIEGQILGTRLIDSRQMRFKLKITNLTRQKVRYALHVAVFDARGQLLGADGEQQVHGLEPGQDTTAYLDILLPHGDLGRAASYQVALYESRGLMGR